MLNISVILFAVAALFGVIILAALVKKKETPKPIVYLHGLAAAVALVVLIIYSVQNPSSFPKVSLIIFILAAVGGFYLFFNDMKKKPGPVAVAVIHALAAVAGFVTLLLFVFT